MEQEFYFEFDPRDYKVSELIDKVNEWCNEKYGPGCIQFNERKKKYGW